MVSTPATGAEVRAGPEASDGGRRESCEACHNGDKGGDGVEATGGAETSI